MTPPLSTLQNVLTQGPFNEDSWEKPLSSPGVKNNHTTGCRGGLFLALAKTRLNQTLYPKRAVTMTATPPSLAAEVGLC